MKNKVNTTRASRDGHEFHEAWTARKALQLLRLDNRLVGIAVEGLSPTDEFSAPRVAVEIADITLYHGSSTRFCSGTHATIVQFKYSIAKKEEYFSASDAKKPSPSLLKPILTTRGVMEPKVCPSDSTFDSLPTNRVNRQ